MDFDLSQYLAERKAWVEEKLESVLPKADGATPDVLAAAMAHALKAGGKRLRPILCMAAAESVGAEPRSVLTAAAAVELLHNYTLVHDDLPCMDNDTLRRGQPTVWKQYGETIAVLAGDALLTLAFGVLAEQSEIRPGTAAALVKELAAASGSGGVIGGQVEDIRFAGSPSRPLLEYVFQHKCADLFRAACRIGGIAAGADAEQLDALSEYANRLGFAFQIQDDLLDAQQAKDDTKPELSCLDIMSAEQAYGWAQQHTDAAVAALGKLPGDTRAMAAIAVQLMSRKN